MAAGRYMAGEWARLGQMGYTGAEDEGMWVAMVGGHWEGEEIVKEEIIPQGHPLPPEPPLTKSTATKASTWHFESDDSSAGAIPPAPPIGHRPATAHKGHPRPQDNLLHQRGGGDGADDPLVGTKVHVPYPTGFKEGTVTRVHRRKRGLSWLNTQATPRSTSWPVASCSPPPKPPKKTLSVLARAKPPPPPPKPSR